MKTEHKFKFNEGKIPVEVRDAVWIEVQYKDGSRRSGNDFDHKDLWVPEKHDRGDKDIVCWRKV